MIVLYILDIYLSLLPLRSNSLSIFILYILQMHLELDHCLLRSISKHIVLAIVSVSEQLHKLHDM